MPKKKVASTSSDNKTGSESILATIRSLVEDVILVDLDDLPGLAKMNQALAALSAELIASEIQSGSVLGEAAKKAADLLEAIILNDSENKENDLSVVCGVIATLQAIVCDGVEASFPEEMGIESRKVEESQSLKVGEEVGDAGDSKLETAEEAEGHGLEQKVTKETKGEGRLPDGVDEDLFRAYLEQQESVLPDIEAEILAYESERAPEHIASIKRMIHTMKGESGVCGAVEIGTLCHKFEDYLEFGGGSGEDHRPLTIDHRLGDGEGGGLSLDLLFRVKDWLGTALVAYSKGVKAEGLDELLEKLAGGGEGEVEKSKSRKVEKGEGAGEESRKVEGSKGQNGEGAGVRHPIADPDLAGDFVSESREHFDIADENLLKLEDDPGDKDAVNAVFRAFHTIKGVCGFIGLKPIGDLAHRAENLLDDVRKEKRSFKGSAVDVTFSALDMLKLMISDLADALGRGGDFTERAELPAVMDELARVLAGGEGVGSGEGGTGNGEEEGRKVEESQRQEAESREAAGAVPEQTRNTKLEIRDTMKVDAEKIDLLLDTIGELVIAESMVAGSEELKSLNSLKLEKNLSLLSKITGQLQDMGMAMRLIPVAGVFKKMARLVRDLSKKSGKEVEFAMEGEDTEVDKGMVDKLGDPLVHMIRNSVDHGVESDPKARVAAGKSKVGRVTLKAFHQGGSIHIQIIDDGRGLDRKKIAGKAIEKGLITSDKDMSDQDVYALIFEAGFSTAEKITEVSGRGVGMDVVRRNIEALRGKVVIESQLGKGSVFTIVLPLTTAIIDGMLTSVGKEAYIIPTLSIVQSFRPVEGDVSTVAGRGQMVDFRGGLLPLFRLSTVFDVSGAVESLYESTVVVVEESGKRAAIVVDELLGQKQTVIKSVGEGLGKVSGISGASILENGRPGLIIDISGVISLATAATNHISNKGNASLKNTVDVDMPTQADELE